MSALYSFPVTVVPEDAWDSSARVEHSAAGQGKKRQKLLKLLRKYSAYKTSYAKQLLFDTKHLNLGNC